MDWTISLRCQQADFLDRLRFFSEIEDDSLLLTHHRPGIWRERVEILEDDLSQVRSQCRQQILASDPAVPVRELWQRYLAEGLATVAADAVWSDALQPTGDRPGIWQWHDRPSLRLRTIAVSGTAFPELSVPSEVPSSDILIWVWVREPLEEKRARYTPIVLGFLPSDRLPKQSSLTLDMLYYAGGLSGYIAASQPRVEAARDWLRSVTGSANCAYPVAIAADGRTVASSSYDGSLKLWRLREGEVSETLSGRTWSLLPSNPGSRGQTLSGGPREPLLQQSQSGGGELWRSLPGPRSGVSAVVLDPAGQHLICGGHDGSVEIWQVEPGEKQRVLKAHRNAVRFLTVATEGQVFASGSADRTVRVWDLSTGKSLQLFTLEREGMSAIALSPQGQLLACGFQNGQIEIWHVESGRQRYRLDAHAGSVRSLAVSDDGQYIASGSVERTLKLWNADTGSLERVMTGYTDPLIAVAPNPNGRWIELNVFQRDRPGWTPSVAERSND